ncbi:PDT-domain-containing protein [Cucurbitaria berberidis CBS 394.84]|uniref:prephenate dehydratase n=1 Tax=Cucurbitaria berberidis CBS 394.84 TaxID=1168544 RepID=A0A9P4GSN1_9PLEO|nr:PDT-domain-containing protein [Cucurbitaria berberidis CBS 394.84]KAF1851010.1 PDT-domain-containing protein [Cucurbitaria berberidis CBS 394.84]
MSEENRPIVAFLGPQGSYTHQATLDAFNHSDYVISPQVTIEDVFTAVQSGDAYRGVIPFENSSNGSVVFTLDLFADLHGKYPDILVCGESYVAVKHCLLGHAPSSETASTTFPAAVSPARPIADISNVKRLYSHPQAWGQCKEFLNTYLKHAERNDVSSTSKAAELVAQDKSGESAALSSIIAADMFDLDVLAKTINDRVENTTRFLVIRRKDSSTPPESIPSSPKSSATTATNGEQRNWKTLITFTVDQANPGALAHCLSAFEKYGLNLTSINTRPSGVENWNYVFFVELKGRKEEEGEEGKVNGALGELGRVCRGYRWLGSWENRLTAA